MAIDATLGGKNSNSYITVAEADALLAQRLDASAWASYTDAIKEAALIQSALVLDESFRWKGTRVDQFQARDWPRYSVVGRDGYTLGYNYDTQDYFLPDQLRRAQAELALKMAASDRSVDFDGVNSVQIGPLKIGIDPNKSKIELVPESVVILLSDLGSFIGKIGGAGTVLLTRV